MEVQMELLVLAESEHKESLEHKVKPEHKE
jgi:hypothetical protein